MATKNAKVQLRNKDLLKQEEIREVVEETVETLLKEHPEAEKAIEEENQLETQALSSKPALVEVSPSEDIQENEEAATETPSVISETSSSNTPYDSSESKKPRRKIAIIVIIIIAIVVLLAYFLSSSGGFVLNQGVAPTIIPTVISPTTQTPTIEATPTVAPTLTPTSTSSAVLIGDLKIQILNGSGVSGLAGVLKERLTSLGFTNIETGNAEGSNSTTTIAVFSEKVPQAFKDTIMEELNKTFTQIDTQVIPPSDKFDVFITTGQGLK